MNKDLGVRIVSAIVFLIVFLLGLVNRWFFLAVFSTFMFIMLEEFIGFANVKGYRPLNSAIYLLGLLTFVLFFFIAQDYANISVILVSVGAVFLVFVSELFRQSDTPIENIGFTVLSLIYISLPFSLMNFIVFNPQMGGEFDYKLILVFFLIIWSTDIGAYFSGNLFGKHPLFKKFSPKKTIEGFFGGTILAFIIAFAIAFVFDFFSFNDAFWFASIVTVFGTIGDLVESMFKRSVGLKDSGKIMPGHGGLLDRFDSSLLSIPFIVLYLYIQ